MNKQHLLEAQEALALAIAEANKAANKVVEKWKAADEAKQALEAVKSKKLRDAKSYKAWKAIGEAVETIYEANKEWQAIGKAVGEAAEAIHEAEAAKAAAKTLKN